MFHIILHNSYYISIYFRCFILYFLCFILSYICALNTTLKNLSYEKLLNILLYGPEDLSLNTNKKIIKPTINFLKTSEKEIYQREILLEKFLFRDAHI